MVLRGCIEFSVFSLSPHFNSNDYDVELPRNVEVGTELVFKQRVSLAPGFNSRQTSYSPISRNSEYFRLVDSRIGLIDTVRVGLECLIAWINSNF